MKYLSLILCSLSFFLAFALPLSGEAFRLAENGDIAFSDNMVLPYGVEIPFRGTADENETVTATFAEKTVRTQADHQGRWRLKLAPLSPSKENRDLVLRSGKKTLRFRNVVVGEVWLCAGQSNMLFEMKHCDESASAIEEMSKSPESSVLRFLKLSPQKGWQSEFPFQGTWQQADWDTVSDFSGVAGFFALRRSRSNPDVPIGMIGVSYGGAPIESFISREALLASPLRKCFANDTPWYENAPYAPWCAQRAREEIKRLLAQAGEDRFEPRHLFGPSQMFNAALAPLATFPLTGVLWYQGESNATSNLAPDLPLDTEHNETAMKIFIEELRRHHPKAGIGQGELPFLMVQLPRMNRPWASYRASQWKVSKELPNVATIVTTDTGLPNDVHPRDKKIIGIRLAQAAERLVDGKVESGIFPEAVEARFHEGRIEVRFSPPGRLVVSGNEILGVQIADARGEPIPAQALLRHEMKESFLSIEFDPENRPVEISYNWTNVPRGNLYSEQKMPVAPFRLKIRGDDRQSAAQASKPIEFDFSQEKNGPVTRLVVPSGTLHAEVGNAEILAPPNNRSTRMLRVVGGKNKSVRFEFDATRPVGFVQLHLERWTSRGPFELKVELQTEQSWVEILSLDAAFKTGNEPSIQIALDKETKAKALRLTATSAEQGGVLLKDVYLGPFGGIHCIGLETSRLQNIATPILIDGKGTPVQQIEFQVFGNVDPLETTVEVELQGTECLASAAIGLGEERYPLEPLKDGNIKIRIDKKLQSQQILTLRLEPKEGTPLARHLRGGITEIETAGRKVRFNRHSEWPVARLLVAPGFSGVHTYRIPGIATGKTGTLLAVYDIRYKSANDLSADIDVGLSRSTDGGETWEEPRVIMNLGTGDPLEGVGDPAILVDEKTGRIWVAALWAHAGHSIWTSKPGLKFGESGQLVLAYSDDDGKTWSDPRNITPETASDKNWKILFNGPGGGITMRDGTLVFAAQYWDAENMPWSTIVYSKDGGKNWNVGTGARRNTTEAQVVELNDGSIMLNMRDNRGSFRAVATTEDYGKTWNAHSSDRSALPDPVCQASLLRLDWMNGKQNKGLIAFMNPNASIGRRHMTLQISEDDGMSWTRKLRVYDPDCYGYSSMTLIDSKHIGILYETNGGLIFQKIAISDIK